MRDLYFAKGIVVMQTVPYTKEPLISVIVPVYKVENYLAACIDSILSQTYHRFELILVDDGSPDRCGVICDEYAEKDSRIRVIHQENMGLSGARNTGIDAARGEYITFIDSDDMVLPQYLEYLLAAIASGDSEIAVCMPEEFNDEDENSVIAANNQNERSFLLLSGRQACISIYNGDKHMPINAWGKMFSSSLLLGERFPVGRIHEDQAIIPRICYNAEKVAALNSTLYLYRVRPDSITRENFSLKRYDDIWAIDKCIDFFREKNEAEIVKAAVDKRKRLLAVYSIYARRDGVKVPKEYHVGLLHALSYLRKHINPIKYEYYLSQVSPKLSRMFEYEQKLKKTFRK